LHLSGARRIFSSVTETCNRPIVRGSPSSPFGEKGKITVVEVHHFKVRSSIDEPWEIPPSKRTAESIAALNGEVIAETMEEVDSSLLDEEGRYFPSGATVQGDRPSEGENLNLDNGGAWEQHPSKPLEP
jgi:hypothetical protein